MCFVESSPKALATALPDNRHNEANHLECMKLCKARDDCDGMVFFPDTSTCFLKKLPLKDVSSDIILGLKICQPVV